MDISLAIRMAKKLCDLVVDGKTRVMPAVRGGQVYDIPFDEIKTDNSVESGLAALSNRLL